MSRSYAFRTLDVFTDTMFGGNPLAVLTDARGLSDDEMMSITREFNLSETVFVLPPEDPACTARVRIFTPGRELPFAGHPTVGTALLLATERAIEGRHADEIVLEEGIGPVRVSITSEDGIPRVARLTVQPPEIRRGAPDVPSIADIAALLNVSEDDIVSDEALAPAAASCGSAFLLVPLRDVAAVSRARLSLDLWERLLSKGWAKDVYPFDASAARAGRTIRARMFAPDLGIGEDPATGSAAASFAGYLAAAGIGTGNARAWRVEQGVEMGRASQLELGAEVTDGAARSVSVAGRAVMVSAGTLTVA